MASANVHVLQMINEITAALSTGECRTVLYLCGSLDIGSSSVAGVKEMIKSQLIEVQMDPLFLMELVFALKRFDILKKVLRTNRAEVERNLGHRHVLSRFRVLMSDLSEDMATEDLKSVKFLLSGTLPKDKIDQTKTFLDVAVELEKLDKVSPERVDFIEQCLRNIDRIDLAKKVSMYQRSVVGAPQTQTAVPCQIIQQQRFRAPLSNPTTNCLPLLHKQRPDRSHRIGVHSHHGSFAASPVVLLESRQNVQSALDEYKLHSDPRGICVIIDCVGSDGEMLEHTFKSLHFKVVLHKWLAVGDMLSVLRGIFRQRENHNASAFVCCIISRGTDTDLLATESNVCGLRLDSVRHLFNAEACPVLAGKPKLFFIQRYSVPELQARSRAAHRDADLETDGRDCASRREVVPTDADVLWSHCWTDEFQLAQGDHHSVYLQALTGALQRGQRRKTNIVDIHTEVNGVIYDHNRRNPAESYHVDLKHTLRKNLYLP